MTAIFLHCDAGELAPSEWMRCKGKVIVSCPHCGYEYPLAHKVGHGGIVTPSLQCPCAGCSFHDFAILEGW